MKQKAVEIHLHCITVYPKMVLLPSRVILFNFGWLMHYASRDYS